MLLGDGTGGAGTGKRSVHYCLSLLAQHVSLSFSTLAGGDLSKVFDALSLLSQQVAGVDQRGAMEREKIRNDLPAGMVTHTITPSGASEKPATTESLFNTLQLNMTPVPSASTYKVDTRSQKGKKWKFDFSWEAVQVQLNEQIAAQAKAAAEAKTDENEGEDLFKDLDDAPTFHVPRKDPLEVMSYKHVAAFLASVGEVSKVIGNGQQLPGGMLFDQNIWTLRQEDPNVSGQRLYRRHIVKGRSDVAVLSEDPGTGKILPWMVKFLIEVKTAKGMSPNGSKSEAMVQLIGLNAASDHRSPPVILTNLARTHSVFYLELEEPSPVKYKIHEQHCSSFAAAVHFALSICDSAQSQDFSRPPTPDE